MKIVGDNIIVNNTYRFVYPIMKLYGESYVRNMKILYKQGVFIDDMDVCRYDTKEYLHIVINIHKTKEIRTNEQIVNTFKWLIDNNLLYKQYILSVDKKTKRPYHIVIMLPLPGKYQGCLKLFIDGVTNLFSKTDVMQTFRSEDGTNEKYFKYCRDIIDKKTVVKINMEDEILNF